MLSRHSSVLTRARQSPGAAPVDVAARIRVWATAMNKAAGMPLPTTSATTKPRVLASISKKS